MLFYFACEAAGASSARHSLRPSDVFRWQNLQAKLARMRSEIAKVCVVGCLKLESKTTAVVPDKRKRDSGPITTGLSCCAKSLNTVSQITDTEYGSLLAQGRRRCFCEEQRDEAIHLRSGDAEDRRFNTEPAWPPSGSARIFVRRHRCASALLSSRK
jgi:hypothetical protein